MLDNEKLLRKIEEYLLNVEKLDWTFALCSSTECKLDYMKDQCPEEYERMVEVINEENKLTKV